jgi:hypothetical protein
MIVIQYTLSPILHRNLPHPNIIFIDSQESINAERIPITMSIYVCSYHKEKEKKVSFDKNYSHVYNEKDTLLQQWRKKVSFFQAVFKRHLTNDAFLVIFGSDFSVRVLQ